MTEAVEVDGHPGPAPQDRPRRRRHHLRVAADHRAARPRPQLHEVHPAHPRHPAAVAGATPPARTRRAPTQTMVNGQTFSGTGYQLDGTENRDPILGIIVINPNLEAIGETKITSQNYDAEFGQAIAGVVSVQTKSGHQRVPRQRLRVPAARQVPGPQPVHAAGRREPAHRPRPPGDQARPVRRLDRRPHREEQAGSSSATTRARAPTSADRKLLTVPTAAARNGDLSAYGVNIFDPASGAPRRSRAQFPGNVIPANRLSPQAQRDPRPHPAAEHGRAIQRDAQQLHRPGVGEVQQRQRERPPRRPPQPDR